MKCAFRQESNVLSKLVLTHYALAALYSSGPNNDVVLNKHVGWIFCSLFIGEDAFQNLSGEKKPGGRDFFGGEGG